jgi:hypothetical protein
LEFFEAIERVIAASRYRLDPPGALLRLTDVEAGDLGLNDPARAHVLLVAALGVIDGCARRWGESSAERDEFLRICGAAFDKARGSNA